MVGLQSPKLIMGVRISPFLLEVGRLSKTAAMVTQCWAATGANLTFLF